MRFRQSKIAAAFLSVCLSTALAFAQSPAPAPPPPQTPTTSAGYPAPYSAPGYAVEQSFEEEQNFKRQFRVQADALYFTRNNRSKDTPVIEGPDSFRFNTLDFDYQAGTRLSVGYFEDDYEFDGSFTTLGNWATGQNGTLIHGLNFDGPTAFGAATPAAQTAVDIGNDPNFITGNTYFSPMNAAASSAAEANELEYLKAGAKFSTYYTSDLQDIEVNFKKRPQPGRWIRFGLGYRNFQFNELGQTRISGEFGAADSGLIPIPADAGTSDQGLSNGSLTGSGLTSVFTVTTPAPPTPLANGFSDGSTSAPVTAPDVLLFSSNSSVVNQLHGVQATADFVFIESDFWELGGFAKAGIYRNAARGSITERYADAQNDKTTYSRSFNASNNGAAFAGHLGLTSRAFVTKNIRVFTAYEVIFLNGLALAPDQVRAVSNEPTPGAVLNLQTHGNVILHGGRLGLEILFP